jgi:RHS repeat-associated protein
MSVLVRVAAAAAIALLAPIAAQALDRSGCKQYGGTADCWKPVIGEWKHGVCGEVGTFTSYSIAVCRAQGGTWNGFVCLGLPAPEYRRPTSEADMQPFAEDIIRNWQGPFCEGPTADGYTWGGVFFSNNCWGQANGAGFTNGYESSNFTTPFAVHGKRLSGTACSTAETSTNYSGRRTRIVHCNSLGSGQDFSPTSGGTPGLCNLGIRQPTNPKQECDGCKSSVQVGNPIDPQTGVKRQVELDYAASGPFPLRFERVYNNRVYTRDSRQWRHNYSAHIENHDFGTVPVAVAHRPSGRVFLFTQVGADYVPDSDIDDRVTKLTDGGGALTGWQYYDAAADSTELYDAEGKLLSITNRAGLTQTLEYSTIATPPSIAPGPGYLIRVSDAFGRQLNFTHDLFGRLATMQDPAGQSYVYESTTQNHFASVTYPDGKRRTYLYNEPDFLDKTISGQTNSFDGRLTGLVDENEIRFGSYFYDIFGIAKRSAQPDGVNNTVVNAGSWPGTIRVTDARGTLRTYRFQSINGAYRNTSIEQPAASGSGTVQSTKSYDANGNVAARVDFNGNRTNYAYDLARNLETSRTEGLTSAGAATPQTRTISTQWDSTFRLPTEIGEPLRITTNVYDADGTACGARGALCSRTIQATTDANGSQGFSATATGSPRTWTYTYDSNGSMLTMNGPRTEVADATSYTYYPNDDADPGNRGNLASVTNAAGHVTSISAYNAHGQPLTIVDANALTTTLVYDARLRLTSRTVGSETTSYEYDGVGQLIQITLPDGSFLTYSYDAAHRMTGMQDNLGNRIAYMLDAMGNRTQEEVRDPANALAQTRSQVFNNLNRLFQEIGAASQVTQYAYDNQGNVTSVADPLSKVTSNAYDALNRVRQVTDPALGVTQYAYNGLDALTQVIDPRGLATGYTVDGLGNLTLQQSPDTGNTANTYDAAGNLLTQTDAKSQSTSYTYDALNRVTLITFHDGSKQAYAYDSVTNGLGRLSSITETDPGSQVTSQIAYTYDAHGRVTSETRTFGGIAYVTAYSYDSFGRMSGMTYPSGRTLTYAFDALGRVSQVSTEKDSQSQVVVQSVSYHPFGGVTGYTFGNGQVYSRSVDQDGRIGSYSLGAQSYGIGYDAASRISFISELGNPPNSNTYGYDALDRLTQAVLPSANYAYSYDAVGNRLTKTTGASTDAYAYGSASNRIVSVTPSSGPVRDFTFDANGSTVADSVNTYAYDARGRMVHSVSSLGTTTYQVNALGQRIAKHPAGGGSTLFADGFAGPEGRAIDDQPDGLWTGHGPQLVAARVLGGQAEIAPRRHIRTRADYELPAEGLSLSARLERGSVALVHAEREDEGVLVRYAGAELVLLSAGAAEQGFRIEQPGAALQVQIELKPGTVRVRIGAGAQSLDTGELALPGAREGERYRIRLGAVQERGDALSGRVDDVALGSGGAGGVSSGSVHFVYDARGRLIGEYTGQGAMVREYAYLQDSPVGVFAAGGVFYVHVDHLNTPRVVANQSGQTVWRWDQQEPFGVNVADENPSGLGVFDLPLRLPGQYFDTETGLHYNYFRDYDPGLGIYKQSDLIGLRGGLNTYAYVASAPLSWSDNFGLAGEGGGFSTRYGNWCGKNWSGGQAGRLIPQNPAGPIDSVDECCMAHDYCWAKYECDSCSLRAAKAKEGKAQCDRVLVNCLDALKGKPPQNWPKPPLPENRENAYFYCQKAKFFFR